MPGNELEITKFLVSNINLLKLNHLGIIQSVGAPVNSHDQFIELDTSSDIHALINTGDSRKKADIYINNYGVSLKQTGSSFSYNRLQRANLLEIFNILGFDNPNTNLRKLDEEINNFHQGLLNRRNRPWIDFFTENEFYCLLEYLMMKGAPNVGLSSHQANYILEAPYAEIVRDNIMVYTFSEYFTKYKDNFFIALRRQWVGQLSQSEHRRALSLSRKPENSPWVFSDIAGEPRLRDGQRWRDDFPPELRRTVYFLMIEKET